MRSKALHFFFSAGTVSNFHSALTTGHQTSVLRRLAVGTGKTYSTSRVIDWVKDGLVTNDNNEGFAYFYCNKQDPARSEPKEILRNIIRQLASGPWKDHATNTAVHKSVHALWLKDRGRGILSTFAEWEACLLELIDTYPRTTIVLDALDECETKQRQDLINLLVKLAARDSDTGPVKIFVAARPEDDIRRHLEKNYLIRMQEEHNAGDIAHFVRAKLAEHRRWSKFPQDFQNEIVEKLLEKSGDMFLFASLQIEQLWDCNTQAAMRNRLSKLPNSLNRAYEEIYRSATSDSDERKILDRALRWVLCSARPLTTDELLLAVSQDPESGRMVSQIQDLDEEIMLIWTHNFLTLEVNLEDESVEACPVWRLAHQAVAEFLEESTCCNSSLAHCESGTVCLMILLDTFGGDTSETHSNTERVFEQDEGLDLDCPCGQTTSLFRRHPRLPDPLAEYAVWGWPTHVRAQENGAKRSNDRLSQTLRKFLGQPDDGSLGYKMWSIHAFQDRPSFRYPEWSVFKSPPMSTPKMTDAEMMAPLTLACHLGIYTCLLDWWESPSIDYNRVYHGPYWGPTEEMHYDGYDGPARGWSLIALACVHNNTTIIKSLLAHNVRINPEVEDDMPPVVAAAVAGSVETVQNLIDSGAKLCSPFTTRHGHLLRWAMKFNSLSVMGLLLQQPGLSQVVEVEAILKSCDYENFRSTEAMAMFIRKGVDVNTPLSQGTLLLAAATHGWDDMVCYLLEKGADLSAPPNLGSYRTIFHACTSRSLASPSTAALLIKGGVHIDSRDVMRVWKLTRQQPWVTNHEVDAWKEVLELQLACKPDMNEIWEDYDGRKSTILIEEVSDVDQVRFLLRHGADANLHVGGRTYGDALSCALAILLNYRPWDGPPSQALPMINALLEAGARLEKLEGDSLHTALAAAAFGGLEDMVHDLLRRGANPYAYCDYRYDTALGAAAASSHPRAPVITHTLLSNGPDVDNDYDFFEAARCALDCCLGLFLHPDPSRREIEAYGDTWLESVFVLARHHAVWDIDFMQWTECLKLKRPEFWEKNGPSLDELQQMLANNRTSFLLKFPDAASDPEWKVKDAKYQGPEWVPSRRCLSPMEHIFERQTPE